MNLLESFAGNRIESAMHIIEDREWDCIHCSLTGSRVGIIEESEIKLCLQMEVDKNPLITAEDLAETFEMRHYAMSSGPAPSLRIHKDHNNLVRLLRLDSQGPARLLTYLSARLLFDTLIPNQRDRDSTPARMLRMQFMLDMQNRIADLPENWHESLTETDEEVNGQSLLEGIAEELRGEDAAGVREGKAAQRCLEALSRLDAIHNLRSAIYDNDLRVRVALFRESEWTFASYFDLLGRIEQDNIVKLQGKSMPSGNTLMLNALIHTMGKANQRMSKPMARFMSNLESTMDKALDSNYRSVKPAGLTLLSLVSEMITSGKNVSREDLKRLESARVQLMNDIESVSWSDRRLDALHHRYGKSAEFLGTAKVIRGDQATARLYQSYKDKGIPVPAMVQAKMDAGLKAGTIKKPSSGKREKKPLSGLNLAISNVLDDVLKGFNFTGKESK